MIKITKEIISAIAPKSLSSSLVPDLVDWMNILFPLAGIDTKQEVRHFLAQAAHESSSFRTLTEIATGEEYEMRKDLGNTLPGYGRIFKGRGIFQITGYINYLHMTAVCTDKTISFINSPGLLATPRWGVWSALIFWNDRHLSDIAMRPDSSLIYSKYLNKKLTPIEYITFRINGGFRGLKEREVFYQRAKEVVS